MQGRREESLQKIDSAEDNAFEIAGGTVTNHSTNASSEIELLESDMDKWASEQGWGNRKLDALGLVYTG